MLFLFWICASLDEEEKYWSNMTDTVYVVQDDQFPDSVTDHLVCTCR